MIAHALSAMLFGLESHAVRVEVDAGRGVPSFELVGLAEASVRESRVRVRSALAQIGVDLSEYAIVVNMAPADVKKTGSSFDLAIATAVCAALRAIPTSSLEGTLFLGELSLTGQVEAVRGVLPQLLGARARGIRRAIVSIANRAEASLVDAMDVRTVSTLGELLEALRGNRVLAGTGSHPWEELPPLVDDMHDVRGQASARRALEVAAAGGHNLLMVGPPGAGKTMLARRLPGILPPLSYQDALEVSAIHSVAGLLRDATTLPQNRPFRAPHHTVSEVGLVGGGELPRPGEISLAHNGVLFLDELPEFRRNALEALRQPLQDGTVSISRARLKATFPARAMLICAMNPCPCGFLGEGARPCICSPERVRTYRSRLSGPLIDRIDLHVVLPPVTLAALQSRELGESSGAIRLRVERARRIQEARKRLGTTKAATNASLSQRDLEAVASLCDRGNRLLGAAVAQLGLSARAYCHVLRIARTLADLEGAVPIAPSHVAEAIGYRVLDRSTSNASDGVYSR